MDVFFNIYNQDFLLISRKYFPDKEVLYPGKEFTCNAGDPGLIPGLGRSAGEGSGYPFQYSWVSLVAQLVKSLLSTIKEQNGIKPFNSGRGTVRDGRFLFSHPLLSFNPNEILS